jgi:hypothetical protein
LGGRPGRLKAKGPGSLGFPLGASGGQVGQWHPRVSLGRWPPTSSAYIKPPSPLAHSLIPLPSSLLPDLAPTFGAVSVSSLVLDAVTLPDF